MLSDSPPLNMPAEEAKPSAEAPPEEEIPATPSPTPTIGDYLASGRPAPVPAVHLETVARSPRQRWWGELETP
jgi:hypothetical protein